MKSNSNPLVKCDECNCTDEVMTTSVVWRAWGRNSFDFQWSESVENISLCANCEIELFKPCIYCGCLIEWGYSLGCYKYANKDRFEINETPEIVCEKCWEDQKEKIRISRKLYQKNKKE